MLTHGGSVSRKARPHAHAWRLCSLDTMESLNSLLGGSMERPGATTMKGNPLTLIGPELQPGDHAPDFNVVDGTLSTVNLEKTGNHVRIISVVPSLDTPVCDLQTKRFNEEAAKLPGVDILTISMDLPFAQKRWCGAFGVDKIKMLSDHRTGSFGEAYGTLIKELRIRSGEHT